MKNRGRIALMSAVVSVYMLFMGATAFAAAPSDTLTPQASPGQEAVEEEKVPDGTTLTPEGSGQVLDSIADTEGTKEFLTITTKNNQTYYVVIDRARGANNVYFLSAVDEADLLDFIEEEDLPQETPVPQEPEEAPQEQEPASAPEPQPQANPAPEPEQQGGISMPMVIGLVAVVAIFGGVAYYLKIVRPKKQVMDADDLEDFELEETVDADELDGKEE